MIKRLLDLIPKRRFDPTTTLGRLRSQSASIRADARAVLAKASSAGTSTDPVAQTLDAAEGAMQDIVAQAQQALEGLAAKRDAAGGYYRLIQATYQTFRPPKITDWMNTILVIIPFSLLEGGMAGAILIAEGRMDVVAGLGYGLIFALVNILTGILVGYLPARHLAYRTPLDLSDPAADQGLTFNTLLIRGLSAFGVGVGLAAEAVLIFGAARLRALGSHEGVFDFSEIGFWETFDDSLAIIVVVIGVCSVILAMMKGYSGLSDPIPGYAEAYLSATADIDDAAEDIVDEAEEAIETLSEAALDQAEKRIAAAKERPALAFDALNEIAADIDAHNDDVRTAQDALRARAKKRRGLAGYVANGRCRPAIEDEMAALEALILPGIDDKIAALRGELGVDVMPAETAVASFEATRERCRAELRAALATFQSSAPNLDALMDEGVSHGTV
ncbi:MAG: hypothetical protein AAGG47_20185 [Pseudomonadota bacterium]